MGSNAVNELLKRDKSARSGKVDFDSTLGGGMADEAWGRTFPRVENDQ